MRNTSLALFAAAIILFGNQLLNLVIKNPAHQLYTLGKTDKLPVKIPSKVKTNWHKKYRHIDPKTGLRTAYYRAALPKSVPGGTRINTKQAFTHFKNKSALLIDVMAHTGTGPDPIDGHWRLAKPRSNIEGSTWLADVGTGTLTVTMENYFKTNLHNITGGDKKQPLIIYCTADCWMAWNAVQRAARWGYKNLLWYPGGTDEWQDQNHPLVNATPIPIKILD